MSIADNTESMEFSEEELNLLTLILEQEGFELPTRQTIQPRDRRDAPPLSFAQERLWFLDQWDPGLATYNVPAAVRLAGRLDRRALLRGLNEIVRRHEALRTTFPAVDGRPVQQIAPALALPLPLVDLRALPAALREPTALRLLTEAAHSSFDLATGPLVRVLLLALDVNEHAMLVNMHHIVTDGWSRMIFIQEIAALYRAFTLGQPSPLPDLPIQYADFALWQRERMTGAALETQLAYWSRQLGGSLPVLDLPTDRPRPPVQTHRGAHARIGIADATVAALKALCQQEGATLFMALLAGFSSLLARYSGQRDIVVGSPIANRNLVDIEPLIGYFVNTLVLRTDLSRPTSFRELLRRVRDTTLDAYAHQNIPFEQLVEELQPERDPSRLPFFQVMLVLQNTPPPVYELPHLAMTQIAVDNWTAKFDLLLSASETARGLFSDLEYNSDLFDATTARRMLDHLHTLLHHAASDPDRLAGELPLMSEVERVQILVDWSTTSAAAPQDRDVCDLIAAQAARTPHAVALVYADQHLSYAALLERANRLAQHLRMIHVGPEVVVGLCIERSIEMIVGLLGILTAGGAYLPLDPTYPSERLSWMLTDAQAPAILVARSERHANAGAWPSADLFGSWAASGEQQRHIIDLTDDWGATVRTSGPAWAQRRPADRAAYVIYTSGSTGRPKGVVITQRGLVNTITAACDQFAVGAGDRLLQFASISFDTAAEEIYPCLLSGATLVLRTEEMLADARRFLRTCELLRLTILDLPTSYWHQLTADIAMQSLRLPASLRLAIIGGEAAQLDRMRLWFERADDRVRLINSYGPTEATIVATMWAMPDGGDWAAALPGAPIGRPIANTFVYVLDQRMDLAPIGAAGELYIGGPGLARGYLGRPDQTAAAFVPNPFGTLNADDRTLNAPHAAFIAQRSAFGARLYRTGDLARWLPDGALVFLGRVDQQIKLRGYRIELGEIEAALAAHPGVRECVAQAREDAPGDPRLVAYVVTSNEVQVTSSSDLRSFLRARLPEYMLPAAFVPLDKLPKTPSGKIDRSALPAPDGTALERGARYVTPSTPLERQVADIWAHVLRLDRIGVHDNFFALGGHSLLATQAVARIRQVFGVDLPLRDLFIQPTVAGLAERVRQARQIADFQRLPLQPRPRDTVLPLSFAQQRLWFIDRLDPGIPSYTIGLGLRLRGDLDVIALSRAINTLVRRHEALRTTFGLHDGEPIQQVMPAFRLPLVALDLSAQPSARQPGLAEQIARTQVQCPFDLTRGPLLRVTLVRLAPTSHLLFVTIHHIIGDGWSVGVIVREIAALYTAYRQRTPATLPDLPIQYADYALWQRQWLQGELLERQLNYWTEQLSEPRATMDLPIAGSRPPVQTFAGATMPMHFDPALSRDLQALGQRAGATLFMTLLAGFAVLLHRYSGQEDILIGSPIANRTRPEIEGLIGFFANTLALRSDLRGNPSGLALLEQMREVCLHAYAHQDLPFERLVEALQPARDRSRTPLFQVMLALQNAPTEQMALPGLALERVELKGGTARFDLTFSLAETSAGIAGVCEYNTDLFQPAAIARFIRHYQTLLADLVAAPDRAVAELRLLTLAEQHQIVCEWNATATIDAAEACVHALIAAQAERAPDAIALVCEAQHLSYAELERRAERLAQALRGMGVGPDVRVGLCLERSAALLIGLLGVLKAGGAYIPLDPSYPPERLRFMIEDAQAQLVLNDAQGTSYAPGASLGAAVDRTPTNAHPDNLAYVIYTSGSTGRPKGVAMSHRALANLLAWQIGAFVVAPAARTAQYASISFDASFQEIATTWCAGGALVMIPETERRDPRILRELLERELIERLFVPFVTLQQLAETVAAEGAPLRLREVITAGEQLRVTPAIERWLHTGGRRWLHNQYGPSETHVVSAFTLPDEAAPWPALPPIGRPIANTRCYALDGLMQPAPIGVAGQLYLGGANLARGYLGRPDLTAARFVPNPFAQGSGVWGLGSDPEPRSPIPDPRLYRTGDLARYRADGSIEFLGRTDHQIKLRGYRIEPGEIEALLDQHPQVRESCVLVRTDPPGDARLVAYIVTSSEFGVTSNEFGATGNARPSDELEPSLVARHASLAVELRAYLAERAPDYMTPSAFVTLDALPLTPSGKLDRRALPAPDMPADEAGFVAPRDATEGLLAGIWAQALRRERVGIHDDFFALGGHSLLAVRLLTRVQQATGVQLPLASLFQHATVAGQAALLRASPDLLGWQPIVPIQPHGRARPLFIVHGIGGTVLDFHALAEALGPDQPLYGLQARGVEDDGVPFDSITALARAYLTAIRAVQPSGPYRLAGWSFGGLAAFELACQLVAAGEQVAQLALLDSRTPRLFGQPADPHAAVLAFAGAMGRQLGVAPAFKLTLPSGAIVEQLEALLAQGRAAGLIAADLTLAQLQRRFAAFTAHQRAAAQYDPPAYTGPLTVLSARDARGDAGRRDPSLGWEAELGRAVAVVAAPGDHYTMLQPPHVAVLAGLLQPDQ